MVDLKYHITSLVAVFLALGLGIIIGSTVVGSEGLMLEQQALIDRLEQDFNHLRGENIFYKTRVAELEKQQLVYEQFLTQSYPMLVKDKLLGKKIILVRTGDFPDLDMLQAGLEASGAQVEALVDIHREKEGIEAIAASQGIKLSEIWKSIGKNLTGETEKSAMNIISAMVEHGILAISGSGYSLPDAVILVGGSDLGKPNLVQVIDRSLAQILRTRDIPVIGVETSEAESSYIGAYKSFGLSTVDNAETLMGRTALVLVLSGISGHYGVKQNAEALLPPLVFQKPDDKLQ